MFSNELSYDCCYDLASASRAPQARAPASLPTYLMDEAAPTVCVGVTTLRWATVYGDLDSAQLQPNSVRILSNRPGELVEDLLSETLQNPPLPPIAPRSGM